MKRWPARQVKLEPETSLAYQFGNPDHGSFRYSLIWKRIGAATLVIKHPIQITQIPGHEFAAASEMTTGPEALGYLEITLAAFTFFSGEPSLYVVCRRANANKVPTQER